MRTLCVGIVIPPGRVRDPALAAAMEASIEEVRGRALDAGPQLWGEDWVIVAEVAPTP
jgi:hypothetical protein